MPGDDYEQFPPIEGNPSHGGGVITLVLAVLLILAIAFAH